jgi:protein-tyrosine-phosphatase
MEADRLPGAVLFACSRNALRSPMAEAMLKHLHGHRIFVDSVGVRAGILDPFGIEVMAEIGIDIAGHRAKTFDDLEGTAFDLIVSLTPEAQHRAVELTRSAAVDIEYWPTLDPSIIEGNRAVRLDGYRGIRDMLWKRICERFPNAPGIAT